VQNLVEHLTVLAGNTNYGHECFGVFLELFYQWCHLDGLGACSEHEHYGFHIYW
jgi:hypothetical protein